MKVKPVGIDENMHAELCKLFPQVQGNRIPYIGRACIVRKRTKCCKRHL